MKRFATVEMLFQKLRIRLQQGMQFPVQNKSFSSRWQKLAKMKKNSEYWGEIGKYFKAGRYFNLKPQTFELRSYI